MVCRPVATHFQLAVKLGYGTLLGCTPFDRIGNRVECLLRYYNLDAPRDLLRTPLAKWALLYPTIPIDSVIVERARRLYSLTLSAPPPPIPYFIGILIDLHLRALGSGTTIADVARNGLLPETQTSLKPVYVFDMGDTVATGLLASIWVRYLPYKPTAVPLDVQLLKTKTNVYNALRSIPMHSNYWQPLTPTTPHIPPVTTPFIRLCVSCLKAVPTRRHIARSRTACRDDPHFIRATAAATLRSYPHATWIAPVSTRIALYAGSLRPRDTSWCDVLEYVYSASETNWEIWRDLAANPDIRAHRASVYACANSREPMPAGVSPKEAVPSPVQALDMLATRYKLGVTDVRPAPGVDLRELMHRVRAQRGDAVVYESTLQWMGVPAADQIAIRAALLADTAADMQYRITQLELSSRGVSLFVTYIWHLHFRRYNGAFRRAVPIEGTSAVTAMCALCRSVQVSNYPYTTKANTMEVDVVTGDMYCAECAHTEFDVVPLSHYTVVSRGPTTDTRVVFTACESCKKTIVQHPWLSRGHHSYCYNCYMANAAVDVADKCVCGREVSKGTLFAYTDTGDRYALCTSHRFLSGQTRPRWWFDARVRCAPPDDPLLIPSPETLSSRATRRHRKQHVISSVLPAKPLSVGPRA